MVNLIDTMKKPLPTESKLELPIKNPGAPSHFRDGIQYAWDATSIKWAQTCQRYYKYKMIDSWESKRKSVHLLFGGWYATALEHYYKHLALGMSSDDALEEVVWEAMCATWEYEYDKEGSPVTDESGNHKGHGWKSLDPNKTRENLIRTIIWYVDFFKAESLDTVILSDGKPAVEHSFTLAVDNGILLSGHLDRLVTYSGDPYVMDQKTTGSTITPRFFDGFDPDTQMSLYTFAGKAIFDLPIRGVIIDGAQIAVGFSRFERGYSFRTESQLDEWYDGAMADIERTQQNTLNNSFPMNPSSCGNYGGCEFRGICSKDPRVREQFLIGEFDRRRQWNPLERR